MTVNDARLARIEERQEALASLLSRIEEEVHGGNAELAKVSARVESLDGSVRDAITELGGVPDFRGRGERPTVRTRLHKVEQDSAAIRLIGEQLINATNEVKQTVSDLERFRANTETTKIALAAAEEQRKNAWSKRQKIGLFFFAAIGALGTIVSLILLVTS